MSECFAVMNALSNSGDHTNSFFVLKRGRTRVAVLAGSWFARPMNDRRSVRLLGVGNLAIASVIDW